VIGGSFAKDTHLKGDHDVDVFVKFSLRYKSKDISEMLADAFKTLKMERVHGSRDYFQLKKGTLLYEIVPVLDISQNKQAQNTTDFSPWHVDWVERNGKNLKGDIRLAKKFCKAAKVYGAESFIRGFSGHVIDILVIHYGGFIPFLEAALTWKPKVIIDFADHYQGQVLRMMDKSKTEGPLIVVDPVQHRRNASSSLGKEKFFAFKRAAQNFLAAPSLDDFEERPLDVKRVRMKKGTVIILEIDSKKARRDVAGSKLLQLFDYVGRHIEEFDLKEKGWEWTEGQVATMWWSCQKKQLPLMTIKEGPPENALHHKDAFLDKYPKAFVKNHRFYARIRRDWTLPREILDILKKDEYVKERCDKFTVKLVRTNE
ncbi:MAG: hypothetical protein ACE5FT_06865, partial [Candidatus Nanoarchaeia archaeon]